MGKKQFPGFPKDKQTWDFPTILNGHVANLTGAEFKVLWYIVRHTWGWQKEIDTISYKQFKNGIKKKDGTWLDKGTGIKSDKTIASALKSLEKKGFIEIPRKRAGKKLINQYKLVMCKKERTPTVKKKEHPLQKRKNHKQSLNKQSLNKQEGSAKPNRPKRKNIKYPKEWYKKVCKAYSDLKGISPKKDEWLPIQQTIKTMFMSERKPKEIIAFMEWLAESTEEWTSSWTIKTVKLKMPEWSAGKFKKQQRVKKYG